MTREQFLALPVALRTQVLFDSLGEDIAKYIAELKPIKPPLPPRYDQPIFGKATIKFASEMDLNGLHFWHKASLKPGDPKYADLNQKRVDNLERWIKYREAYPDAVWTGERNRQRVTAAPPSSHPNEYAREYNGGGSSSDSNGGGGTSAPQSNSGELDTDDEIPF